MCAQWLCYNKCMAKQVLAVIALIFASLAAIYFFVGTSKIYVEELSEERNPHIYGNSERSISKIKIFAVYFAAKNKTEFIKESWGHPIQDALINLQKFHFLQFAGLSKINYAIYPRPVIGLKESIEYDTETTDGGNPSALLRIAEELENRIFNSNGDLFLKEFIEHERNEYPVLAVIYEGVGAVGGIVYESELEIKEEIAEQAGVPEELIHIVDVKSVDGFFLTNILFLQNSTSVFAHEFYHTLGIPDAYATHGFYDVPLGQDIMGIGRFRPIEKTYFEKNTLKQLGV